MNQRTISVDITDSLTNEQINDVKRTADMCKIVFEVFRDLCIEHKSTAYFTLHKFGYEKAKRLCPNLPSSILQSAAKLACSCVKSFNSNNKKNKWNYVGKMKSCFYSLDATTLSKRGDLYSFSTCNKRIRILLPMQDWFTDKYKINKLQAGKIIVINKKVKLNLVFNVEPAKCNSNNVVGIDRGIYNLVATSDGMLYSAKEIRAAKRRFQHNRKTLQQKGTRSAKKRLKAMSGREKRFMSSVNHFVTKQLAENLDVGVYAIEDLKGIRKQRYGKTLNKWLSNWSYFQFETYLKYKCEINNIKVEKVDPRYTSQKCSVCGSIIKQSRKGNHFKCKHCGYEDHADINAAKNIRKNYLLSLER